MTGEHRPARLLAGAIAVTGVAVVVAAALVWGTGGFAPLPTSMVRGPVGIALGMVVALCYLGAGWLLASRSPRNPIGWLLLGIGVVYASMAPTALLVDAAHRAFRPAPALTMSVAWAVSSFAAPLLMGMGIIAGLIFPDGRVLNRRWRSAVAATVVGGLLLAIGAAINPAGLVWYPSLHNPFAAPESFAWLVSGAFALSTICLLGGAVAMVVSLVARYRRGDGIVRAQLRWILYAVVVQAALLFPFMVVRFVVPVGEDLGEAMLVAANAGIALLPIAATVAITCYRLWGIDFIIGRTLVYVPLMAILGGLYTLSIAVFQRIFVAITNETSDAPLLITVFLVAAAFTPVRKSLEGMVDRWIRAAHPPAPGLPDESRMPADVARTAAELLALRRFEQRLMAPGASAVAMADGVGLPLSIDEEGRVQCPAGGRPSFVGCLGCRYLLAITTTPPTVICTRPVEAGA
jgi:two-component system, NarL family, sensor kinase